MNFHLQNSISDENLAEFELFNVLIMAWFRIRDNRNFRRKIIAIMSTVPTRLTRVGKNNGRIVVRQGFGGKINLGGQDHDEGQAGPYPGVQDEGQARSNPSDVAESQPQSSHVVHTRPNLEHMYLEATDASTRQNPEQMDEEFTTTAYPKVQENLKLPSKDLMILEEPASSTGTLSSLQNLESFTYQFFVEKQQEEEPGKTNAEAEVQSMVLVPIYQYTSSVPLMTTLVIDLTMSQSGSPLPTSTATTSIITTTTSLPPPPQQSTADLILVKRIDELKQHINLNIPHQVSKAVDEIGTDAVDLAMQAPLQACFSDLPSVDMKEILQQWMFEDKSYEAHEDHKKLYDALKKSLGA
nr:hypothetical protein [Tanacetum cinerariifolium]